MNGYRSRTEYFVRAVAPLVRDRDTDDVRVVDCGDREVCYVFGLVGLAHGVIATPCFDETEGTPVEVLNHNGLTTEYHSVDWVPCGYPEIDAESYVQVLRAWARRRWRSRAERQEGHFRLTANIHRVLYDHVDFLVEALQRLGWELVDATAEAIVFRAESYRVADVAAVQDEFPEAKLGVETVEDKR